MFQLFQRPTCPLLRDSSETNIIYRMRLNKYTHKVVLYISIALFISYFVLTSVPKFDTEENKIYFKSLYIISFVLLIIYSLLKNGKK